jgi:O-Antigen ligase
VNNIVVNHSLKFHEKLLYSLIAYCFLFGIIGREINGLQVGLFVEVFLIIGVISTIILAKKLDWKNLDKDFFYLILFWFVISVLEVMNPNSATLGWLAELRSTALYPLLMLLLGMVIFNSNKHLDYFLILIIALSTLATLNGIKQLYIGLSPGEQRFLSENSGTHLLWGRLRVFSFYSDAGQFGASQGHIGIMTLILALIPMKMWKRLLLVFCGFINLYGMLISGTRGALFIFVTALIISIVLMKNVRVIIIGGIIAFTFLFILKYTHIGDSNYQIFRLRTALNPEDASLNVRFNTQRNLRVYMENYPFGGGLGVIGYNGVKYNSDKYLSTVQPDSYYVKLWAMYGIVGFTIWFCIMMYIFGKSCGIVWNIQDKNLRIKIVALTAGFAGILVGSYGNEVINIMPTSIVIYLSWAIIANSAKIEKTKQSTLLA